MNDNWYKEGGWYKPLNTPQEKPSAPAAEGKKLKKKRITGLAVFLLVLGLCFLFIALRQTFAPELSPDDYDVTEQMPRDFRDYLDSFYAGVTGTPVSVDLPAVEERGSLSLSIAGSGSGQTMPLQQLYEKCSPSVVYVKAWKDGKDAYSWGTGVVASADGYILTNTHVIAGCDTAEIGLTDGSTYEAKLVGSDGVSDIALLRIEADGLTPAVFASDVSVGDSVIAIGNPLGESYRLTMTDGIISAKERSVNHNGTTMNLLQTNAAINEGNSGGPLFNQRGQVVGITNMKVISGTGVEGIGFAIPTETVRSVVDAIMDNGAVYGRSTIGITVGIIPDSVAEHYDIPKGLYISYVQKGSDAAKQGVKAGDILTEINGTPVETTEDVSAVKDSLEIGSTMHFTIWRSGKTLEFDVELMDANDIYNSK